MKCTGKFKDDFDNMCLLKNIKYVPEVIPRSRRPGSALQNAIIVQQQLAQQQQLQQSDVGSQVTGSKKTGSNSKSKSSGVALVNPNADIDHDIEQNPGLFIIKKLFIISIETKFE